MSLAKVIKDLDFSRVKEVLYSKYKYKPYKAGRPPNNPTGMILALVLMILKGYSTRDIEVFLRKDKFWRRLLGFKSKEPDHTSFSDFIERIGLETFTEIFRILLQQLVHMGAIQSNTVAVDSTIILATRNDKDARWTKIRNRAYFGYKLHLIACVESELPVAILVTPANVHDSIQFTQLYNQLQSKPWYVLADAAYDSTAVRNTILSNGGRPYIKTNLGNNKRIKPIYSGEWNKKYNKRTAIERLFYRLKNFLQLRRVRVSGIRAVTCYLYLGCIAMLLFALIGKIMDKSIRGIKSLFR